MVISSFNIVNDSISEQLPILNVDMVEVDYSGFMCDNNNLNLVCSSATVNSLLRMAAENGVKAFNIFLTGSESKPLLQYECEIQFGEIQSETTEKIAHAAK